MEYEPLDYLRYFEVLLNCVLMYLISTKADTWDIQIEDIPFKKAKLLYRGEPCVQGLQMCFLVSTILGSGKAARAYKGTFIVYGRGCRCK